MKKVLIAPDMTNLAESHRMASFAASFVRINWDVIVLGKGRYDYVFSSYPYAREIIQYDEEWFTEEKYYRMHHMDQFGIDFYEPDELESFTTQEVSVLERLKPDIVVTGFRPTISVSCKIAKIPLVWLLSAVLSDMYFEKRLATIPYDYCKKSELIQSLPTLQRDGFYCRTVLTRVTQGKNWVEFMKKKGLRPIRSDLQIFRGDFNIMSDLEVIYPEFGSIPDYYTFCGPLFIEHRFDCPPSLLSYRKKDRPVIFFSMGSSGDPALFNKIVEGFRCTEYDVFVGAANLVSEEDIPASSENVFVERYFPLDKVGDVADLAVFHGGQGTLYSLIMSNVPFIGIPMFCEQQYNLETFVRLGCGKIIPKFEFSPERLFIEISTVLENKDIKKNVEKTRESIIINIESKGTSASDFGVGKIIEFFDKYNKNPEMGYFANMER